MLAPRASPFEWHAGAWYGAAFGMTTWLIVAAVVVLPLDPRIAALVAALWAVNWTLAIGLWMLRAAIPAFRGFMAFIVMSGGLALAVLLALDVAEFRDLIRASSWGIDEIHYEAVAVYPILGLFFWWRERTFRARAADVAGRPGNR